MKFPLATYIHMGIFSKKKVFSQNYKQSFCFFWSVMVVVVVVTGKEMVTVTSFCWKRIFPFRFIWWWCCCVFTLEKKAWKKSCTFSLGSCPESLQSPWWCGDGGYLSAWWEVSIYFFSSFFPLSFLLLLL